MKTPIFLVIVAVLTFSFSAQAAEDINTLPMYEGKEKTNEQKKADEELIQSIKLRGISLEDASKSAVKAGFMSMQQKNDFDTAIKRFNQAWLFDNNNGDSYYGFAMVTWLRDKDLDGAEKFFQTALKKGNADNSAYLAYSQLLFSKGREPEAIPYLEELLKRYPPSAGARPLLAVSYARKKDLANACKYAKATIENKESLVIGTQDDYCK